MILWKSSPRRLGIRPAGTASPRRHAPALGADFHYALKQFDWLVAHAAEFDPVIISGDLLDLVPART